MFLNLIMLVRNILTVNVICFDVLFPNRHFGLLSMIRNRSYSYKHIIPVMSCYASDPLIIIVISLSIQHLSTFYRLEEVFISFLTTLF